MDDNVKTFCETIFTNASFQLAENKSIPTLFFALKFNSEKPDEKIEVMPIFFTMPTDSLADLPMTVHKALKESDADAFLTLFVSETIALPKERENELFEYVNSGRAFQDHPESKECLCLHYTDAYGKDVRSIIQEIKRDIVGTPYVEEGTWIDQEGTEGGQSLVPPWK